MDQMKELTFEEYKKIHKKLTKTQRAYYETHFEYRSKLNDEILLEELKQMKEEIAAWREKTLKKIRAEKFLADHQKIINKQKGA